MRWHEITNEHILTEKSFAASLKNAIMDVIVPLKSQNLNKVTVKQVVDTIRDRPEFKGYEINDKIVSNALGSIKGVDRVEPDPDANAVMTVFFDIPKPSRQVSDKAANRDKEKIRKAALRTINRKR